MRLFLLLLPLLVNGAPNTKTDDVGSATIWLNTVLTETKDPIDNRFNLAQKPGARMTTSCTTPEGQPGRCVQIQFCDKEPKPRDTTTMFQYRELGCTHYMLQCCPINQIKQTPKKSKSLPAQCGWSNPGGYNLRSTDPNDGFSRFGDFPWMVAILRNLDTINWDKDDYIGGGTLIHPSVVLTVAHKLEDRPANTIKCRAGEWDSRSTNEFLEHQDRNVKKIIIHAEFLALRAHFDGALLFLESPFDLVTGSHIGVACLARDMPVPGSICYSMGWGRSFENFNVSINSALLKKIQLPPVDSNTCQNQLRKTILGNDFELHNSLMCAGGEAGQDTCIGDGGSSYVCSLETRGSMTRYIVYGMVAYGVGCGAQDVPGVYVKVPAIMDWVDRKIAEENLNKTVYVY